MDFHGGIIAVLSMFLVFSFIAGAFSASCVSWEARARTSFVLWPPMTMHRTVP